MTHKGAEPASFTGALHTYLTVGAIEQTHITGLENTSYLDTIDSDQQKPQTAAVQFDREVDRVYLSNAPVQVHDAAWGRVLEVSKSGSQATVVWNPWVEKPKRLADLPDEAYHGFLCIEAANAGHDVIHLAPGQMHELSTRIVVS
jgi:glucose-6-phosphate 1-epimerase